MEYSEFCILRLYTHILKYEILPTTCLLSYNIQPLPP